MNEQAIYSLKEKWLEFLRNFEKTPALTQFRDFHTWWRDLQEPKLALQNYTALVTNENNGRFFTNWMERLTVKCGRFSGNSSHYGIYHVALTKLDGAKRYAKKTDPELNDHGAKEYFENTVLPQLQKIYLQSIEAERSILGINFQRKIAYIFHSDKFLPIFKNKTLENIIKFFEIDDANANQLDASRIILKWFLENSDWIANDFNDLENEDKFKLTLALGNFLHENFNGVDYVTENTIYYGPPGTGKTYVAIESIKKIITLSSGNTNTQLQVVQFHPSYAYEDFIEGYKPKSINGQITLELKSGKFKSFCKLAADALKEHRKKELANDNYPRYYFIADEINRAELSRVFGEALVCIEQSKRFDFDCNGDVNRGLLIQSTLGHEDTEDQAVVWSSGKASFGVPLNVVFVGTMNCTDRSIDAFDLALRRRFQWEKNSCDYEFIAEHFDDNEIGKSISDKFKLLNQNIRVNWGLGEDYEIGHAFVTTMKKNLNTQGVNNNLKKLYDSHLAPLLTEYLRADYISADIKKKVDELKKEFVQHG